MLLIDGILMGSSLIPPPQRTGLEFCHLEMKYSYDEITEMLNVR